MELVNQYKKNPFEFIETIKISFLTKLIKFANNKYRNTDKPVLKDEEYDLLIDELKKRKPNHSLLKKIGAQVHSKNKINLPFHMGSMDKIKPGKNLVEKWVNKYDGPYIISDKLDGTSGLLELPDMKLYTRGNGTVGTDITSILQFINIPKYSSKKKLVIRGEFIISKKLFKNYDKKYSNSRAMVNGLINKKCAKPDELKLIDFVAYEVVYPTCKISEQFKLLNKFKFNVVFNKQLSTINEEILSNLLKQRKKNSNYDIDGIIVVDNKNHKRNVSGNPKYAFAYKDILEEQIAKAEVIKVEWRISKDGLIKPRIHIKPVEIGGVVIKHVTGHNAKYIQLNGIGHGAKIKLIRSGDVIPYILNVDKKVDPDFPNLDYKWNKTKIDIKINKLSISEKSKQELLIKNITFFFKKMNIKYVDESIVKKFILNGLDTIKKIVYACIDDFMEVEGFKDTMANKIYNNIQNAIKNVSLARVMYASNIFGSGLGEKKLALITKSYPNILKIRKKKDNFIEMINEIDGFNTKTSTTFVKDLPKFKKFLKNIPRIKINNKTIKIVKNNKYFNKIFVFSGFRNKDLELKIEQGGGKVNNSISTKTSFLVVKDKKDTSSKITKAKELNIKIITINEI